MNLKTKNDKICNEKRNILPLQQTKELSKHKTKYVTKQNTKQKRKY